MLYEREFNRVEEEKPYLDAMSRVVNHSHQRNPKKKW
ncbi:transcriptional regulator [Citrobacter sp. B72]|nr:transcriptional regulator [Citrobacter sp. B72]